MNESVAAPQEELHDVVEVQQEQSSLVDTSQVQFEELLNFAADIGFHFNGKSFIRDSKNALLKTVTTVSFSTMNKIYNSQERFWTISWATCGKYSFFILNTEILEGEFNQIPFYTKDVAAAFENKALRKVKLQITRKSEIIVLSHKIEFLDVEKGKSFAELIKAGTFDEAMVNPDE